METCLAKSKEINFVYTINEPAATGAAEALDAAGVKATIVSVDGGCDPGITSVKSGVIGATSQQYPLDMAKLGVEAIAKKVRDNVDPAGHPRPGLLRHRREARHRQAGRGRGEHHTAEATEICWGEK